MRRIVKIIAYIALVVLMQDSCQKIDNLSKAADSKKEEIEVQREVAVTSFYAYSGENDSKTKTSRKRSTLSSITCSSISNARRTILHFMWVIR